MSLSRCLLCNSASHKHTYCNSNMKGRSDLLMEVAETMMMDDTMPDFNSFAINELRYIASHYMQSRLFKRRVSKGCLFQLHSDPQRVKYLRSPIPLTHTKTRMVKDLTLRWASHGEIRTRKRTKPEDDNCPICMECMLTPAWDTHKLAWDIIEMLPSRIITKCKHSFCGSCWGLHIGASARIVYVDHLRDNKMCVKCPLCRTQMLVADAAYQNADLPIWD